MTAETLASAVVLVAVAWFAVAHSVSLLSVVSVYARLRARRHRVPTTGRGAAVRSGAAPGISIVIAAADDPAGLVERIQSLLVVDYPRFEVVVTGAGPADGTLAAATRAFDLVQVPAGRRAAPKRAAPGVYRSLEHPELVVLDTAGAGRSAAIDAGVDAARYPLVCLVGAGAIVEAQALARAVRPFVRWPATIAAAGGIRIANGGLVDEGRGVRLRLPASRLAVLQVVERLTSHVPGQVNLSAMNGLLAVPSAFGLFEREALVEAGGVGREADGGDVDLTLRLHRVARGHRRGYRIAFEPDPVCWIVVPERWRPLAAAVRRRQRVVLRALSRHRSMILNPRFGTLGLLILPSSLAFEAFGPLVETAGYVVAAAGLAAGVVDRTAVELLFLAAIVYGTLVSVAAVLLEELSSGRDAPARDLLRIVLHAALENLGYRQAAAWWRLGGVVTAFGRGTADAS